MGVFWASSATNFSTLPGGARSTAARACLPRALRLLAPPPRVARARVRHARSPARRAAALALACVCGFGLVRRGALSSPAVWRRVCRSSPPRAGVCLSAARSSVVVWGRAAAAAKAKGESGRKRKRKRRRRRRRRKKGAAPRPRRPQQADRRRRSSSNHPTTQPPNHPTSTQQHPPAGAQGARNGVVGTLGACAISPSSAYGPPGAGRKAEAGGQGDPLRQGRAAPAPSSTKEAGVEPGFWEPLGRARLVHLVPMACRRRGRPTRQEGRRRQAAPPAPTQQGRNRGLGTLGACMISPSSAYVLLWAGAGAAKRDTTYGTPRIHEHEKVRYI